MRLAVLVVAAGLVLSAATSAQAADVSVGVDRPPQYSGACPPAKRVHFNARIRTTSAADVTYQWVRNDNALPPKTAHFTAAGFHSVPLDWTLSKTYSGWVAMRIISPVGSMSRRVQFHVDC